MDPSKLGEVRDLMNQAKQIEKMVGTVTTGKIYHFEDKAKADKLGEYLQGIGIKGVSVKQHIKGNPNYGVVLSEADVKHIDTIISQSLVGKKVTTQPPAQVKAAFTAHTATDVSGKTQGVFKGMEPPPSPTAGPSTPKPAISAKPMAQSQVLAGSTQQASLATPTPKVVESKLEQLNREAEKVTTYEKDPTTKQTVKGPDGKDIPTGTVYCFKDKASADQFAKFLFDEAGIKGGSGGEKYVAQHLKDNKDLSSKDYYGVVLTPDNIKVLEAKLSALKQAREASGKHAVTDKGFADRVSEDTGPFLSTEEASSMAANFYKLVDATSASQKTTSKAVEKPPVKTPSKEAEPKPVPGWKKPQAKESDLVSPKSTASMPEKPTAAASTIATAKTTFSSPPPVTSPAGSSAPPSWKAKPIETKPASALTKAVSDVDAHSLITQGNVLGLKKYFEGGGKEFEVGDPKYTVWYNKASQSIFIQKTSDYDGFTNLNRISIKLAADGGIEKLFKDDTEKSLPKVVKGSQFEEDLRSIESDFRYALGLAIKQSQQPAASSSAPKTTPAGFSTAPQTSNVVSSEKPVETAVALKKLVLEKAAQLGVWESSDQRYSFKDIKDAEQFSQLLSQVGIQGKLEKDTDSYSKGAAVRLTEKQFADLNKIMFPPKTAASQKIEQSAGAEKAAAKTTEAPKATKPELTGTSLKALEGRLKAETLTVGNPKYYVWYNPTHNAINVQSAVDYAASKTTGIIGFQLDQTGNLKNLFVDGKPVASATVNNIPDTFKGVLSLATKNLLNLGQLYEVASPVFDDQKNCYYYFRSKGEASDFGRLAPEVWNSATPKAVIEETDKDGKATGWYAVKLDSKEVAFLQLGIAEKMDLKALNNIAEESAVDQANYSYKFADRAKADRFAELLQGIGVTGMGKDGKTPGSKKHVMDTGSGQFAVILKPEDIVKLDAAVGATKTSSVTVGKESLVKQLETVYSTYERTVRGGSYAPEMNKENLMSYVQSQDFQRHAKTARIYYNSKQLAEQDALRIVAQREPTNIAMGKGQYDKAKLKTAFGYSQSVYKDKHVKKENGEEFGKLPNSACVYSETYLWDPPGGTNKKEVSVLSLPAPALDSPKQPHFDHYVQNGKLSAAKYEEEMKFLFDVTEQAIRDNKDSAFGGTGLKRVVLSKFGQGAFLAGLSKEDQQLANEIYQKQMKEFLKRVADTKVPIVMIDYKIGSDADRWMDNMIEGDIVQQAKPGDLIINAWDPHSAPGNGNDSDRSLDGAIGMSTGIVATQTAWLNERLKKRECLVKVGAKG